jgi:hypothetical protein
VPYPLDSSEKIFHGPEPDAPFAKRAARDHLCLQLVMFSEEELLADCDLAAGTDQALPLIWILRELPSQQNFDTAAEKIPSCGIVRTDRMGLKPGPASVQSRRKHAGIVEYDQIVSPQELGKVAELAVAAASRGAFDMK